MNVTHLQTTRTARYYSLNNNEIDIKEVVFVLHGYAMQASAFAEQFRILEKPGRMIVAPEGLSRFYRRGTGGDVVASWMTRDDRTLEISDYIGYLNQVYRHATEGKQVARTVVLGFSQGASTASRWVMHGDLKPDALLLWCGEFAPDIQQYPEKKPVIWNVVGDRDEYISREQFILQTEKLRRLNFKVREVVFAGGHVIDPPTVEKVVQEALNLP